MARNHSPLWPNRQVKPPYGSVEIDWGHPLARGLAGLWLFNQGTVSLVNNLATPGVTSFDGSVFTLGGGRTGPAIVGPSGTSSAYGTMAPTYTCGSALTTEAWVMITQSQWHQLLGVDTNCATAAIRNTDVLATYISTAGVFAVTPLTKNVWHHCAWVINGTNVKMYLDGIIDANATAAGAYTGKVLARVLGSGTAAETLKAGKVERMVLYSRALTGQEVFQLYADPYCFLRPLIRRSYGWKASGAPPSFKGYWAYRNSRAIGAGVI